ncbi:MAG TPA: NADH-quinone oxidoreductase subunit L [Nitrososphaerales archaeon]|nr:NADH-quinone oxidoreductase subunit L [Nitrososphaerales archaeon]
MTSWYFDIIPNLVWMVPIAGGGLSVLVAAAGGKARNIVAILVSLLAALLSTSLLILPDYTPYTLTGKILDITTIGGQNATWVPGLHPALTAGVLVDPLTAILATAISWISFLIMVYSLGYMKDEQNLTRYYFLMNFFIGNMLLIVMSDNFLQLFLGWEGVGYCSYALIGFWSKDEVEHWVGTIGEKTLGVPEAYSPTQAGIKAFIMTRLGDVAFLIGILIIFAYARTFNFHQLYLMLGSTNSWASNLMSVGLFVPSAILIFGGAIGKSAQFPLHEWLPDAMAGPTSVSALIHAATMVNAGVILVGTVGPLYYAAVAATNVSLITPFFLTVGIIGGFTAFLAASQAMVLDEVKKVLAYSTVSQIGYMMLGLGVAGISTQANFVFGFTGAFFHLISQAMFKAGLFMCAGWLIHVTGSRFMKDMGGLRKDLKITFVAMLIVALSLAGIVPLSGFWSKEAILGAALQAGKAGVALWILGLATALMTAFYSMRMIGLIFYGDKSANLQKMESEHSDHGIHEAPYSMMIPYLILAAATVAVGLLAPVYLQSKLGNLFSAYLSQFNLATPYTLNYVSDLPSLLIGLLVAVAGVGIGYIAYFRRSISPTKIVGDKGFVHSFYTFFEHRWYINAIYYHVFVYPVMNGSTWLFKNFEQKIIEPINIGAIDIGATLSSAFQDLESGIEEEYVLGFGIGIALLIILLVFFGQVTL